MHENNQIRTEVADQLYTYLSLQEDNEEEEAITYRMEAEEILTMTDWYEPIMWKDIEIKTFLVGMNIGLDHWTKSRQFVTSYTDFFMFPNLS